MSVIEVAISPGEAVGSFRMGVVSSPAGEASAVAGLDVGLLMTRRPELQQAVLASAVATRKILPESERCVREVGHQLFAALLGIGEVAGRYRASAALAAERGEPLRVVLRIGDPALAGLPWEAMYDEAARSMCAAAIRWSAMSGWHHRRRAWRWTRCRCGSWQWCRRRAGFRPWIPVRERELLEKALARLTGTGLAEVTWAPSAAWADLQDILLGGVWHAVHFIGHGDFDPGRDEGDTRPDKGRWPRLTWWKPAAWWICCARPVRCPG